MLLYRYTVCFKKIKEKKIHQFAVTHKNLLTYKMKKLEHNIIYSKLNKNKRNDFKYVLLFIITYYNNEVNCQ